MGHSLLRGSAAFLVLAATAEAQLPDVAIVAAASASLTDCRYTDVQAYLLATGQFASVDIVDCVTTTPVLADLTSYDALLTWSNSSYFDGDALGDVFADYYDQGGAVVVAVFATTTTTANRWLGGRWLTGGYEVILTQQGNMSGGASLGTILQPAHPTVAGLNALTATSAFRPTIGTPLVQGSIVAEWDDGAILCAAGTMARRVDLGMYPPSSNCSGGFWNFAGDGDLLVANALTFVATGGGSTGVGTNYCMANPNSTGVAAEMSGAGSAAVAANDLTLTAASMPNNSFGFFLTSQTQGFVVNPGGSQGNLCLGGAIGRYVGPGQIQNSGAAGEISLVLDLTQTPTPTGLVAVQMGETWNFTAWFRDAVGGMATSNFADGLEVTFL